jgi:hypothetical protein
VSRAHFPDIDRMKPFEARLMDRLLGDDPRKPWHERMAQARRWHYNALTRYRRPMPNHAHLLAVAARHCRHGLSLDTRDGLLADYRRVIRRNLWTKGSLP